MVSEIDKEILRIANEAPCKEGILRRQLRLRYEDVGLHTIAVRAHINELTQDGHLRETEGGKYVIAESGKELI